MWLQLVNWLEDKTLSRRPKKRDPAMSFRSFVGRIQHRGIYINLLMSYIDGGARWFSCGFGGFHVVSVVSVVSDNNLWQRTLSNE